MNTKPKDLYAFQVTANVRQRGAIGAFEMLRFIFLVVNENHARDRFFREEISTNWELYNIVSVVRIEEA